MSTKFGYRCIGGLDIEVIDAVIIDYQKFAYFDKDIMPKNSFSIYDNCLI